MKRKCIILLSTLTFTSIFTSCKISDTDLPDDIRQKFEEERNGSVVDVGTSTSVFSELCTIEIIGNCILNNSCAYLIDLSGTSKGYKYFFTNEPYSEEEVRNKMNSLEYIEGSDYNFASDIYANNGKRKFLYVVGYADKYTYGPIAAKDFYCPDNTAFVDKVSQFSFKSNNNVFSITFSTVPINYFINYRILFDDDADYAKGLSAAKAVLYAGNNWERVRQTAGAQTISVARNSHHSIFVITRISKPSGAESKAVACFYQEL